ncbi:MAG: Modification methylase MjaV [Methanobacterium sp. PtaU1.Bin242]|nr:MAG: Modification methylase MjaV [Methanobacterium sp. PtaU1.Bin242]
MDCLDGLKDLDDNSIDLICTDPPYGLKFMGKDWDKALPNPEVFKECYRVLKPGAWINVMSAPRSDLQSRMSLLLEDAGFNIGYTPIYWAFASGFPKAGNLSKMADKRLGKEREVIETKKNPYTMTGSMKNDYGSYKEQKDENNYRITEITAASSDEAKALDGSYSGFQPKPAVEVVIVALKPLSERTYIDQALKSLEDESVGLGGSWLDDARIPYNQHDKEEYIPNRVGYKEGINHIYSNSDKHDSTVNFGSEGYKAKTFNNSGRFPANLLCSDDILNDGKERKTGDLNYIRHKNSQNWNCFGKYNTNKVNHNGDSGSFSRYFDLDRWVEANLPELPESVQKTYPFLLVPKASKSEKNKGLDEQPEPSLRPSGIAYNKHSGVHQDRKKGNHHPTVKPIKLFTYLITLFSRPGQTVLDPYTGSGTTCIAAKLLKRDYIGFELENEYKVIADARLKAHRPEPQISLTTF